MGPASDGYVLSSTCCSHVARVADDSATQQFGVDMFVESLLAYRPLSCHSYGHSHCPIHTRLCRRSTRPSQSRPPVTARAAWMRRLRLQMASTWLMRTARAALLRTTGALPVRAARQSSRSVAIL